MPVPKLVQRAGACRLRHDVVASAGEAQVFSTARSAAPCLGTSRGSVVTSHPCSHPLPYPTPEAGRRPLSYSKLAVNEKCTVKSPLPTLPWRLAQ
eukprot:2694801-Prymnesium_polylepis.1